MTEGDGVARGVYLFLAMGGLTLLWARAFAYWLDWDPWRVRIIAYVLVALGLLSLSDIAEMDVIVKVYSVTGGVCFTLTWLDLKAQRRQDERDARLRERILNGDGGDDDKDDS
jgi:hypothetical protein